MKKIVFLMVILVTLQGMQVASAGLMAHWKLNSLPVVADEVGPGQNNGVVVGNPSLVSPAPDEMALDFNGVDDYLDMGNDTSLSIGTGNATLSAWVKYDDPQLDAAAGPLIGAIAGKGQLGVVNGHGLYVLDNKLGYQARSSSVYADTYSDIAFNDGQWHYVVGVLERGLTNGVRLYVDSVLQSTPGDSTSLVGLDLNDDSSFFVGCRDWPADINRFHFNGQIDDVQLYDYALTQDDIDFLYANPGVAIPEPTLLALLGFGAAGLLRRNRRR